MDNIFNDRSRSLKAYEKDITWLKIERTNVSDFSSLAALVNLERLSLSGNHLLRDLTPLAKLTKLRELELVGTNVEDLTPLATLPHLEMLVLDNTPANDLTPLSRCPALTFVGVSEDIITAAQAETLERALPACRVQRD